MPSFCRIASFHDAVVTIHLARHNGPLNPAGEPPATDPALPGFGRIVDGLFCEALPVQMCAMQQLWDVKQHLPPRASNYQMRETSREDRLSCAQRRP